ncbi:MAG: HAD family hydrolase [Firmicutes bacterium]|nr:HAD family hydrolase [Bacillota bacterium]
MMFFFCGSAIIVKEWRDVMNYRTDLNSGLSFEQVELRKKKKLVHYNSDVPTKTFGQIITSNIFTLFNLLNLFLGFLVFLVGSYKNLLFLGVVFCNTAISIIQEIRAKLEIDKLSLISEQKVDVIRDGKKKSISLNDIVVDDIISYKIGNQIVVDSIIRQGTVEVNESFITGEANSILKRVGDTLLSGSFVVSSCCLSQVIRVGEENYTSKISKDAKYIKKINSLLLSSLNKIIKLVSFAIIPIGLLLFINQFLIIKNTFGDVIVNVVAALIAMIPEGLVLLTSTVLAVSSLSLSRKNVLVSQLYSIETLGRVDTICFDKTGTLTEGTMEVKEFISLTNKKYDHRLIMSAICNAFELENETMTSLYKHYGCSNKYKVEDKIPFSSERKYSKVRFEQLGTFVLGAPDIILGDKIKDYNIDKYVDQGRVLLLAEEKYQQVYPIGLILIEDKIRPNVLKTINYLKNEKVDIKIISGDSPNTILNIAKRLGLGISKRKDVSKLSDKQLIDCVEKYNIFGRVNPFQKKLIIETLKKNGHTVAMIGDGVNDVLALKEADSSVVLNSGSSAARNVSEIVLMDNNFDVVPSIIEEGRKTINNIERSSSLYIVKTVYATLLAVIFTIIPLEYPFIPIQLTLTSAFTIGIPSFILALEPNKEPLSKNFLINIFEKSIPSAFTIVLNILIIVIIGSLFNMPEVEISTLSVILTGFTAFLHLYRVCKPLNHIRRILIVTLMLFFTFGIVGFKNLFSLTILNFKMLMIILVLIINTIILWKICVMIFDKHLSKYIQRLIKD